MRSRSVLLAMSSALVLMAAPPARSACPRNGGTVCNVPGDVSQVTGASFLVESETSGPYGLMEFAWTDSRNAASSGSDVYSDTRTMDCLDSTLSVGTGLITPAGDQTAPVLGVTGDQPLPRHRLSPDNFGLILTWQDGGGTDQDIYARRYRATLPLTAWDTAPIPICDASGDQTAPVFLPTGRGGAFFGWLDRRSGTSQVYAQVTDSAGIALWTPNGVPVAPAGGGQESMRAAADGAGGAYLCWLDHRAGNALYATRFTRDGGPAPGWAAGGDLVAGDVQLIGAPHVIADASGLTIAWSDRRADAEGDVFMQRLAPDGSPAAGWSAGGSAIASGPGAQRLDDLAGEAAGHCLVVWEDEPTGAGGNSDLFATRLDASGAPLPGWPATVCVASGRQEHARIMQLPEVSVVVFADDRGGDRDLYAAGLAPDGTRAPGWVLNGTLVTGAPDVQDNPVLIGDVVAWTDYRDRATNGADLYGATLSPAGRVDVLTPPDASRLALSAPRPNPARHGVSFALELGRDAEAEVAVFDCAGRRVVSIARGRLEAGRHPLAWDGRTSSGAAASPGVYFIRARAGTSTLQRPVVLAR